MSTTVIPDKGNNSCAFNCRLSSRNEMNMYTENNKNGIRMGRKVSTNVRRVWNDRMLRLKRQSRCTRNAQLVSSDTNNKVQRNKHEVRIRHLEKFHIYIMTQIICFVSTTPSMLTFFSLKKKKKNFA